MSLNLDRNFFLIQSTGHIFQLDENPTYFETRNDVHHHPLYRMCMLFLLVENKEFSSNLLKA